MFVGNRGAGNGRGLDPMHGAVQGDYWVSNADDHALGEWYVVPRANANVSMFEPSLPPSLPLSLPASLLS